MPRANLHGFHGKNKNTANIPIMDRRKFAKTFANNDKTAMQVYVFVYQNRVIFSKTNDLIDEKWCWFPFKFLFPFPVPLNSRRPLLGFYFRKHIQ